MSEVRNKAPAFFDLLYQGSATEQQADDFAEAWHRPGGSETRPLAEFLGMTDEEYAVWCMALEALSLILLARRNNQPLRQVMRSYLAALRTEKGDPRRSFLHAPGHWLGDVPGETVRSWSSPA